MIPVIILAAGESKRMGKTKQLLPIRQNTILGQTIDNFLLSTVSEVIVVIGHQAGEVAESIGKRPVKVVISRDYRKGMSASLRTGLNSISRAADGVMIALADQPFIGSGTINCLIEQFNIGDKGIVVPVYNGERGHPVIFAGKYVEELLSLTGDAGGRAVILNHPDDIREVSVDSKDVIIDIDTPQQYRSETKNRDKN